MKSGSPLLFSSAPELFPLAVMWIPMLSFLALSLSLPVLSATQDEQTSGLAEGWQYEFVTDAKAEEPEGEWPVEDDLGRSVVIRKNQNSGSLEFEFFPIPARYLRSSPLHRSSHRGLPVFDEHGATVALTGGPYEERANLHILSNRSLNEFSVLLCEPVKHRIRRFDFELGVEGPPTISHESIFAQAIGEGQFSPYRIQGNAQDELIVTASTGTLLITRTSPAQDTDPVLSGIHIIQRLARNGEWNLERLSASLGSESPHIRAAALRAFEPQLKEEADEAMGVLMGALRGGGEIYSRQLGCSLGQIADTPEGIRGYCVLMTRRSKDPWLRLAVRSGLEGQELVMLRVLIGMRSWQEDKPGRFDGTRELASDIIHSGRRVEVLQLLDIALDPKRQPWHLAAIAQAFQVPEEADATESLKALRAKNAIDSAELRESFLRGQEIYQTSCTECHRPSGYGYDLRSPAGRVADGDEGLESLKAILSGPKHEGVTSPDDLSDLHRYLRMEWQPLKN